jgi:hypothetical protein
VDDSGCCGCFGGGKKQVHTITHLKKNSMLSEALLE